MKWVLMLQELQAEARQTQQKLNTDIDVDEFGLDHCRNRRFLLLFLLLFFFCLTKLLYTWGSS